MPSPNPLFARTRRVLRLTSIFNRRSTRLDRFSPFILPRDWCERAPSAQPDPRLKERDATRGAPR
jgi:hypothetical protein